MTNGLNKFLIFVPASRRADESPNRRSRCNAISSLVTFALIRSERAAEPCQLRSGTNVSHVLKLQRVTGRRDAARETCRLCPR